MKLKKLFYLFMILPLILVIVSLAYLPEIIPAHYGINNHIDRWGSKYELLFLPAVNIITGIIILLVTKNIKNGNKNKSITEVDEIVKENSLKAAYISGIVTMFFFNVILIIMLYTSFNRVTNLSNIPFGIDNIIFLVFGLFFIIIGSVMPSIKKNMIIGMRTKWSMKNDTTWEKTQKFSGMAFIICGILTIIFSIILKEAKLYTAFFAVLFVMVIVDIIYSYIVSKKY